MKSFERKYCLPKICYFKICVFFLENDVFLKDGLFLKGISLDIYFWLYFCKG